MARAKTGEAISPQGRTATARKKLRRFTDAAKQRGLGCVAARGRTEDRCHEAPPHLHLDAAHVGALGAPAEGVREVAVMAVQHVAGEGAAAVDSHEVPGAERLERLAERLHRG